MSSTTIKLDRETKSRLDRFREYKNESYDEVLKKLMWIAEKLKEEPDLSKEAIEQIEKARERIKSGDFVSEEEARERLGIES